jgi:CBS domain-containing protein
MFALGVIGFMIGAELRGDVFKKYGRQFFIILFSQGIGAFLLVAVGASAMAWFITHNLYTSIAMGLVLGAIASATAPAATANVLWEYKTRGPLTAAILAIVALDDALALLLYRAAATGADALMGTGDDPIFRTTLLLLGEIAGAIVLGFLAGVLLYFLLKFVRADDKIKFSPPVYTAFFVLAGAHMEFDKIAPWIVAMIAVYILCRTVGKILGSWFGARRSGAPAVVRKYLGICLLPQAGVAIGLAILSGQQFDSALGHTIIMVVMTATFLMEILGPMLVKLGVKKAGEVGMNVTEEDLIKTYKVKDVMDSKPTSIAQDLPLHQILEVFSTSDNLYYPVIGSQSRVIGIITIADIKEMFANQDVAGWLLACDVAEPVLDKTTPNKPLEEAMEQMRRYDLENMPVVASNENDELIGVLDYRAVNRKISAEVLHRRKIADEMAPTTS